MKFIKLAILSFLLLFLFLFSLQGFKKNALAIEEQDHAVIESFFKVLINKHTFAYTLFGDKPCSLAFYGYHKDIPLDMSLQNFDNLILTKGLKCWKKYSKQIQNSNFLLKHLKDESHIETIAIINKQSLKSTLQKNIGLIQRLLDSPISVDELFNKI